MHFKMNILKNIQFSQLLNEFSRLKHSISEWVIALDTKQYDTQSRVKELEQRVAVLESIHNKVVK